MFTLLAMFAGKPDMIPRPLLSKPHSEWTTIEKKEAEKFLSTILKVEKNTFYLNGKESVEEKYIAVVSDNPKVEAEIDISLFNADIRFKKRGCC